MITLSIVVSHSAPLFFTKRPRSPVLGWLQLSLLSTVCFHLATVLISPPALAAHPETTELSPVVDAENNDTRLTPAVLTSMVSSHPEICKTGMHPTPIAVSLETATDSLTSDDGEETASTDGLGQVTSVSQLFDLAPSVGNYETLSQRQLVESPTNQVMPIENRAQSEPSTDSDATPSNDNSGTNPTRLTRTLTFTNKYQSLPSDSYLNLTRFRYTQPFPNQMSLRFTVPLAATDVLGEGSFGLGDLAVKWGWVAEVTPRHGLVFGTELAAPTASETALGSGKWVLSPSITYAIFANRNIILAPAYVHNFSFAGDGNRADVHRGDFDLYMVYTPDSKDWALLSDITISFDYERGTVPASWEVSYQRTLTRLSNGAALNATIRPGIGIGSDRLYDWSLEVGISLVGF